MEDLRLYYPSGNFEDIKYTSESMKAVLPEDSSAVSIEVIAGKVVKFMLTEKGSDAFNPNYGSISMHHRQMSPQFLPTFTFQVKQDLEDCFAFIKAAELDAEVDGERLYKINLLNIRYDPINTPHRVDVYIEVLTTYGKRAIVTIVPGKTDV